MKNNKITNYLLVGLLAATIVGCGGNKNSSNNNLNKGNDIIPSWRTRRVASTTVR